MEENENASVGMPEEGGTGEAESASASTTADATAAATGEAASAGGDDSAASAEAAPVSTEEITYHAVEKDGHVTAIWEMQGRKHLRTIDPRSRQGQDILRLYTAEHPDETGAAAAAAPATAAEGTGA